MNGSRLSTIASCGVGFDTETHLVQPGLMTPPLVCGSIGAYVPEMEVANDARMEGRDAEADLIAGGRREMISAEILSKPATIDMFSELISDKRIILVGANIAYDLLVMANELAKLGIDAMPEIFQALADDRVFDLQLAEALHAIAGGHLGKDPRTGGPLINPETGKPGRYSLATCVDLVLGRKDAKVNDEWRLRYAELDGVPMSEWPPAALDYPVDDARNTIECALAQCGYLPTTAVGHDWGNVNGASVCLSCGRTTLGGVCYTRRQHRNLHDLGNQVYTAFVRHTGGSWGFRVDQRMVDVIERIATRNSERGLKPFMEGGLIREDGSENRSELKRRIALSYGSTISCDVCAGTGKVLSKNAKPVRCRKCRGVGAGCDECGGTGKKAYGPLVNCFAEDGKTCDGTGLVLGESVPRADKEGIAYGADVLHESDDPFLMAYGDYGEDRKDLTVYVPFLRTARQCRECGQHGTEKHPHTEGCSLAATGTLHAATVTAAPTLATTVYNNIPLTLRYNPIVDTGRVSCEGVIQLFKRKPGYIDRESKIYVPSARECIRARDGYVFSSEDYKAGELFGHGQSCIWLLGFSDLADALLQDVDPHSALAATVLGVTYDEFIKRKKERKFKDVRQAAKPFTFGKPTGMGSVKLVLGQRKQGPNTPHPCGPSMIDDGTETGNMIPGYKGLRFCILMNNADACGTRKITQWGKPGREQTIPPTCVECLECAERLGQIWLHQWRENKPYFEYIADAVDNGMLITSEALERWPHLKGWFEPNTRLGQAEVMQHVSGRVRGGVTFTSAANGFFQALIADAAKSADRRVARECYDRTVVVPDMAHFNSRRSAYANGPSPLLGSRPIGFFHDELFMEHPIAMGHDGAMRVSEIMVEELSFYCPDVAPAVQAEPTLMEAWYKNAERTVDSTGRLIPWRPKAR